MTGINLHLMGLLACLIVTFSGRQELVRKKQDIQARRVKVKRISRF
jgi:hypothetical protein